MFSRSLFVFLAATALPGQADSAAIRAGQLPGTLAYNVTLSGRSFNLNALRQAISELRPAAEIQHLIGGYEAQTQQDQLAFVAGVQALGGSVTRQFWIIECATIEIAPNLVDAMAKLPTVLRVTPDWVLGPDGTNEIPGPGPLLATATNANNHNADHVQQVLGLKGTGFSIAQVNSGLDANMANTGRPHLLFYRGGNVNDRSGGGIGGSLIRANVSVTPNPAEDPTGFGTLCASVIAGNGWGAANADIGHGYDASFVSYAVCDGLPNCGSSASTLTAAYQRCISDRVTFNIPIVHMGYQGIPDPLTPMQQAADECGLLADQLVLSGTGSSRTIHDHPLLNGVGTGFCQSNTKIIDGNSPRGPFTSDALRFVPDLTANGVGIIGAARDNENSSNGTSHYEFYGAGCAGSSGIPTLVVPRTPLLGASWTLGLAHGRANSVAALWFGVSDTNYLGLPLPYALGALAPGCSLLASLDVLITQPTDAQGGASVTVTIPADPSLLGGVLFNQALVFDAVNPLGMVLTQGGRLTVGSF